MPRSGTGDAMGGFATLAKLFNRRGDQSPLLLPRIIRGQLAAGPIRSVHAATESENQSYGK
jgi:hypothetical protein